MAYKTVEGTLYPDGSLALAERELPPEPVRVMVTVLADDTLELSELGDYLPQLEDYEACLARGEIQWQ